MIGHKTSQPNRFRGDIVTHEQIAGRGGIPFVEHQVERLEHRIQAGRELAGRGHAEAGIALAKRALGAHQALRNRAVLGETRAGDLADAEAAGQFECERHPRIRRQRGMANQEDQSELIVFDRRQLLTQQCRRRGGLGGRSGLLRNRRRLVRRHARMPEAIERAILRHLEEPGFRLVGHAAERPLLKRGHQGVLHRVFGDFEMA